MRTKNDGAPRLFLRTETEVSGALINTNAHTHSIERERE